MQIAIKRTVERIPGGLMIVPLAAGATIVTVAPNVAPFFGSFTGALFTGSLPILAVFYVCLGATIRVESLPYVLRRGGALFFTKTMLGVVAGVVLGHALGERPVAGGWLAGFSTLAVVAAANNTNGGLYLALMQQFGTPEEAGAYALMCFESGPFLTMATLGAIGLSAFPWPTLLGGVLPLAVGVVLGNVDRDLRDFLGRSAATLVPFFAFALGATLDLRRVWQAGLLGIVLALGVLAISAVVLIVVDRLAGGTGIAGVAAASTAGSAAATPALVAAANPAYAAAAGPATILVAASVILSAFTVPFATAWWAGRVRRKKLEPGASARSAV